jgi:subtilisin family serine protease
LLLIGCSREIGIEPLTGPALATQQHPGLGGVLIVGVRAGVNPASVWADYGFVEQDVLPDGHTYLVQIPEGRSLQDVLLQIQADFRIDGAEVNMPVGVPVLRQSSMSFNEGQVQPGDFFDQTLSLRLGLSEAHKVSKGHGVKVAILDTGADLDHSILQGAISSDSYDFVDRDNDPSDRPDGVDNDADGNVDEALGHGSHVAGLVALVAPRAELQILRILNSDGAGTAYVAASAIEFAVNTGADIINMSFGLSSPSAAVERAIHYAQSRGVAVVQAAGNLSPNGAITYPASDPRVWAIAAVDAYDQPASFSSRFEGVVLSAPGENILSTYWNGGYAVWSGTSIAAPIVSGTAALLWARYPFLVHAQVRAVLQSTASPILGGPDGMGAGRVNPRAAVGTGQADDPKLESARR